MKKATLLLLLALAFAGCKKDDTTEKENGEEPPVEYETVNIGGTEWMLYNLANPRQAEGGATFATKLPSQCTGIRLESHGKLYQWGINVAWNTIGESINGATPGGSWNTSTTPADWTDQPCPKGYRLPTNEEFKNLLNNITTSNGGGWSEDDYGYKVFASKDDKSKSLEFPAVGWRYSYGSLTNAGACGDYWSSVACSSGNAYYLDFGSGSLTMNNTSKLVGFSVRCVKGSTDNTTDPDDPDNPDTEPPVKYETVNIAGSEWMLYNLANPKQAEGGATFVTKLPSECSGTRAESHGKFYQYGINVAWNSTGSSASGATPSGSWNTSTYPSNWNTQPCPKGYRLPTETEFHNLINSSTVSRYGGWDSSDYGYIRFTSGSNSVEFPAVGFRATDGSLGYPDSEGYYWSSVANGSDGAYYLGFSSGLLSVGNGSKWLGHSVRCVKGNTDPNPVDPNKKIDPFSTIEIAGTEWMPLNLANPKQASGGATFATKLPSQCSGTRAESHGKFYQWGINVAWNTTTSSASGATPSGSWNTSTYPADWNTHPCPEGYRLPANTEFQNLINSSTVSRGGGWSSSDYGYIKFTSGSNSVEFPAVGWRYYDSSGTLTNAGTLGYYWSSVASSPNYAYFLWFNSSNLGDSWNYKQSGRSVRCVKGNLDEESNHDPNPVDPDKKIDPFSTIEIGGTEWMPLNLAKPKQSYGGATFATKLPSQCNGTRAESHGKFYQWGINVAWNTTGSSATGATPSGSWNTSTYHSNWNTHPCPEGYRLPTKDEFQTLINSSTVSRGGGWNSSDYGYIKLTSGSNSVEFPAVGFRNTSGTLGSGVGANGYYWSSVANGFDLADCLWFSSGGLSVNTGNKRLGFSVRCVRQ